MRRTWWTGLVLTATIAIAGCGDDTAEGDGDGGTEDGGVDLDTVPERLQRYIRSDSDTRLVLEVDYVEGFEPYGGTGAEVASRLEAVLDKPDGVEMTLDQTIPGKGTGEAWTSEELLDLAEETNDLSVPDGTVKIHVMFLDGQDESTGEGGTVLGLAWNHLHIAIYKESIEESCTSFPLPVSGLCEAVELSILIHEIGHTIGLVDNGLPMQTDHKDPDHGAHDVNEDCIMYWAYEGENPIEFINDGLGTGGSAPGFDQACLDDIAAVRDM
ncbi:MAG: hypothetical protein ACODAU_12715 [Myxococcota bacterium]